MHGVGPVGGALEVVKGALLADQVLLGGVGGGHVAGVSTKARRRARGAQVVVRRAAVPEQQVARAGVDLDPLAALVLEPGHALLGEAVPLLGPGPDAVALVLEGLVELLAQHVRALAHDQAAVLVAVGEDVDQALKASEAGLLGVLVLVRPGLVGLDVLAVGERDVDGIKRHDQVGGVVHLLKGLDDTGLLADTPCKGLVLGTVAEDHALLGDDGEVLFCNSGGVISLEAETASAGVTSQYPG